MEVTLGRRREMSGREKKRQERRKGLAALVIRRRAYLKGLRLMPQAALLLGLDGVQHLLISLSTNYQNAFDLNQKKKKKKK